MQQIQNVYWRISAEISGDGIILPNTITPRPGDFFSISYVKEDILFKVNEVSSDTLDTGANIYKIGYSVEYTDSIDKIDAQVEKNFNFVVNNVGTDFKTIIQDCDYDLAKQLEVLIENLITTFEDIFFDTRLQTFVYNHDGWLMYDPFMIEFFIRNNIMKYGNTYKFVAVVVDEFGGIEDLNNKIIRCVGVAKERFTEDALRILRAVRFSAQLGFEIEEETREAAKELAPTLKKISRERIQSELSKLMVSPHPDYVKELDSLSLNENIFEDRIIINEHTLRMLLAVRDDKVLRWTALLQEESTAERAKEMDIELLCCANE